MSLPVADVMATLGRKAREAAHQLASTSSAKKNEALLAMARALRQEQQALLRANAGDVEKARDKSLKSSFIDRLTLTPTRIEEMAAAVEHIAKLPDPVGTAVSDWVRPNGLHISRVRVPIGVIGLIFESRPNVATDAGALCLKSGNAAILRGGSDGFETVQVIGRALQSGLMEAGLPLESIQVVPTSDREGVGHMLQGLNGMIDLIVPRGGRNLVERVRAEARVPVFSHLDGLCHVYVDRSADLKMAEEIVVNSKMRRTGICGSAETVLIDRAGQDRFLKPIIRALIEAGCEVRGDEAAQAADAAVKPAVEADWSTEYLDAIISLKLVDGVAGAISHIERYGSQHTDSIVAEDKAAAERFLRELDSAIVLHNASTQFADGGEFGFGAEIGIATGKLHARGPVGVEQLTTFKYVVRGTGQTRP